MSLKRSARDLMCSNIAKRDLESGKLKKCGRLGFEAEVTGSSPSPLIIWVMFGVVMEQMCPFFCGIDQASSRYICGKVEGRSQDKKQELVIADI